MTNLSDRQQHALEHLAGHLCTEIYVLRAWAAWRSPYRERDEKVRRDAEIADRHVAIRCIRRKLRRAA